MPLLIGAVLDEPPRDELERRRCSTGPASAGPQRYVKRHPVPFGEYIPVRAFFRIFTAMVDLVARDFVAGDEIGRLHGAGGGR